MPSFQGGIVTRVYTLSPKKPNSAIRKVTRFSHRKWTIAVIWKVTIRREPFFTSMILGGKEKHTPPEVYYPWKGSFFLKRIGSSSNHNSFRGAMINFGDVKMKETQRSMFTTSSFCCLRSLCLAWRKCFSAGRRMNPIGSESTTNAGLSALSFFQRSVN